MPGLWPVARSSMMTRLIALNLMMLLAIGGVVVVNAVFSGQIGRTLNAVIDRDVAQVIGNAALSRDLNTVIAQIHLLLNAFTDQPLSAGPPTDREQPDPLVMEGERLIDVVRAGIAASAGNDEVCQALTAFRQALETLLEQCGAALRISRQIAATEQELQQAIVALEALLADVIVTRRLAGREYEISALEQVNASMPDYRSLLLQIAARLAHIRSDYAGAAAVGPEGGDDAHIAELLADFTTGLLAITTAGAEFAEPGDHLLATALTYREQITTFHAAMRVFQDRFRALSRAQEQVLTAMAALDAEIADVTARMRATVARDMRAFRNMTAVFSAMIVFGLIGAGAYAVSITRPILRLTVSAAAIADGNLDAPIDLGGVDEVGMLARSFVRMRDAIREQIRALADINAELQKENLERHRAEERVNNQNLVLEQAVQAKQREMEVMFERLLRHEKLAAIGQMAGSIAHELRNPLGAVKNSIFYLKRLHRTQGLQATNPKVAEHLDLIEHELVMSERVISDLLDMTRMRTVQRMPTELRPILNEAVQHCVMPPGVRLTIDLAAEAGVVLADAGQLRQVFINLLTNAVQAIDQEGVITVRARRMPDDDATVIDVADTGRGIEPQAIDKLFDPLYTTKATGTGLGLPICKQIIENHQGRITVDSHPGRGTTITLVLPDHLPAT